MEKTAEGPPALREDLGIARLDPALGLVVDGAVAQRSAVVRRALEDREVACRFGNLLDDLDAGGARPDHANALTGSPRDRVANGPCGTPRL